MSQQIDRRNILQVALLAPALGSARALPAFAAPAADPDPLIVIADLVAKAGSEDALRAVMAQVPAAARNEPGCRHYTLLEDRTTPGHFTTYEIWASRADLDDHMARAAASPLFSTFAALLGKAPTQTFFKLLRES